MITTLFLFYEEHIEKLHQSWHNLYTKNVEKMFEPEIKLAIPQPQQAPLVKSYMLRKKDSPSIQLQYQFVELVEAQITELQHEGKSEEEIITCLKEQKWDPQVIYLALSRKKDKAAK